MDDNKIVELFWRRDETAIAETEQKYSRYCYHISYNILSNCEDAEECVNDTWWKAWNAMPPHRPNQLSAFLGKITRNLSLQRYLRAGAQKRGSGQTDAAFSELEECLPDPISVEQIAEDRMIGQALDRFLRSLPKETRMIFVIRYWYLCSIRDIAEQFGISESKVKTVLFRTRKKLKIYLEREGISL